MAREARIELARRKADDFCEVVLKDEKGNSVKQSEIHREIQWHIDECRRQKKNCGILAPWRHGKTEQVTIARSLQFLGENRNNRIFIVCNSDDNAVARVSSISKYIEKDKDYHEVYPHIKPAEKDEWSKHRLMVERESKSKDASVEAWGITSSGTGTGCDFLILDDPVDLRNAILNPALRKQVKDAFYNVWSSRLAPEGFLIYIATVWHNDDLTNELLKNPNYYFLIMKISDDFSCIECKSPFKGSFKIPLWNEAWPKERLIDKKGKIGEKAFNRGFRQRALSDEDKTFPSAGRIFKYGVDIKDLVSPEWPKYGGMDPFGQWTVIFTLAVNPEGKKYPIDIRRGKWPPAQAVQQLIDSYRTYKHQIIKVENNAAQEAIMQWALEKGGCDLSLDAFITGKQKADPTIGLPSLEVEFSNEAWVVAMGEKEHEPDCECGFCWFKRELDEHPIGETADIVMAAWFAREAYREGSLQYIY